METVSPNADSWAPARAALRAADPRMASLVDADPTLEPDAVLDGVSRIVIQFLHGKSYLSASG